MDAPRALKLTTNEHTRSTSSSESRTSPRAALVLIVDDGEVSDGVRPVERVLEAACRPRRGQPLGGGDETRQEGRRTSCASGPSCSRVGKSCSRAESERKLVRWVASGRRCSSGRGLRAAATARRRERAPTMPTLGDCTFCSQAIRRKWPRGQPAAASRGDGDLARLERSEHCHFRSPRAALGHKAAQSKGRTQ